jgi:hypothetical protein
LNAVNTHCKCVDQVEAFGVLGQDRREHAGDDETKSSDARLFRADASSDTLVWAASLRLTRKRLTKTPVRGVASVLN